MQGDIGADYIHSREDSNENERVMRLLENHDLDVIIQVRKLGEGFDHPYLSVAAIFSIFSSLSPFVQFVGRIMRVIVQNHPGHIQNEGTVVFHAGANVARRWEDFQEFSQADQDYFDQLLPVEELFLDDAGEMIIEPRQRINADNTVEIMEQHDILLEEIPLFDDEDTQKAFEVLMSKNITPEEYKVAFESHKPILVPRARQRQAARKELDELVKNEVGRLLASSNINPQGSELDKQYIGKTNFIVLKSEFDKKIADLLQVGFGERSELSYEQINLAKENLQRFNEEIRGELIG